MLFFITHLSLLDEFYFYLRKIKWPLSDLHLPEFSNVLLGYGLVFSL